jgi:hypothetical protein
MEANKMTTNTVARVRNPFRDLLVTELIENPAEYKRMFSPEILVGESTQVFLPGNIVLVGPQGCGKSMLLNLIRFPVTKAWISSDRNLPRALAEIPPWFGISINLVRSTFHAFGRRSVSRSGTDSVLQARIEVDCAADYLNHYLFREFLQHLGDLKKSESRPMREWLGVSETRLNSPELVQRMSGWSGWFGHYTGAASLEELSARAEERLQHWKAFINGNTDSIPSSVASSKSPAAEPLHEMGNLLQWLVREGRRLPLFIVIDQYGELPELNSALGVHLQRLVNGLVKGRDPVVFYKIGARTYEWGRELRVLDSESRIEVQRDYHLVNLADALMRNENPDDWIFPEFARDVATRRMKERGGYNVAPDSIKRMMGTWTPESEAGLYFRNVALQGPSVVRELPANLKDEVVALCTPFLPLEMRLASAWALQRLQKRAAPHMVSEWLRERPWAKDWSWRKERNEIALLQIASYQHQRKLYFGWETVLFLSGGNITAFLAVCAEIWDAATKVGENPTEKAPISHRIQTEGVHAASEKWAARDRIDVRGSKRYEFLGRLGPAIRRALVDDAALSNPGHSGFSVREPDLWRPGSPAVNELREFLARCVDWTILEERAHTSKEKFDTSRRKFYLHPLLSPRFGLPVKRVKEPLYVPIELLLRWFQTDGTIDFRRAAGQSKKPGTQRQLPSGHTTSAEDFF